MDHDKRDETIQECRAAISWAKTVITGGYLAGSSNSPKRKHMKILLKLAKKQFQEMKDFQCQN